MTMTRYAMQMVQQFLRDEAGVTAIEYGLLALLVALAVVAGITALGGAVGALWTMVSEAVSGVL